MSAQAICSAEGRRVNWDEGGEGRRGEGIKREVDERERVGRKEVREKKDQEGRKY